MWFSKLSALGAVPLFVVVMALMARGRCFNLNFSTMKMVLDKKMEADACQKVYLSSQAATAQCARMCDVSTTCRGFTLTCPDLGTNVVLDSNLEPLFSACHCLVCFGENFLDGEPTKPSTAAILPMTSLRPQCPPPPLISRTSVTHMVTSTHDVAHYSCNVSTDVYINGTTDVKCKLGEVWPGATILCVPTTCWYKHDLVGPVYAGNVSVTKDGYPCQAWALNQPQTKNAIYEADSMYPSDGYSKVAAKNYCRVFKDGYSHNYVWCYWNDSSSLLMRDYSECDVPLCDSVPGTRLN